MGFPRVQIHQVNPQGPAGRAAVPESACKDHLFGVKGGAAAEEMTKAGAHAQGHLIMGHSQLSCLPSPAGSGAGAHSEG